MPADWGSLPLLPLRCVLDHLSTEDALAAMSTCRHWRNAVLLYEGHKDTLKLRAKNLDKNLFVTRMFRRYVRKLHVYLDCSEQDLEQFMNFVLPRFFDTANLQELIFIGPSYEQHNQHTPSVKLKRIIIESLVFKHAHSLQKLGFLGCEMAAAKNENDRYSKHVLELLVEYSRPLTFVGGAAADAILSHANSSLMVFSAIQHIIVEYEQINTCALETLSGLARMRCVTLNISGRGAAGSALRPLDWPRVQRAYTDTLHIALNIIAVPTRRFNDIIQNVLVEGLALTSLKVLFCKTMYMPLVSRVTEVSRASLRELVWADAPHHAARPYRPTRQHTQHTFLNNTNYSDANPFVILCWQCDRLRRLAIHGYWVWQYDLVGMARLSKSLAQLEVSAVYSRRAHFPPHAGDEPPRVTTSHAPSHIDPAYIREVNEYSELKLQPCGRTRLHAALLARSSPSDRADYALLETTTTQHYTHE